MDTTILFVNGIDVHLVRKNIKTLRLSVHPPEGDVRVSAPIHVSDDRVKRAVVAKLGWIKKQQAYFQQQPRQLSPIAVSGETHYVFGNPFCLEVIERYGRHEVVVTDYGMLQLLVTPGTTDTNRMLVINAWYRTELKARIPALLEKWQEKIGVEAAAWGVKRMKTRWGSCNIQAKRIWLSLELAKKPSECLEYVLVHELVHLLERRHNDHFTALMDRFMPGWQVSRDILSLPME